MPLYAFECPECKNIGECFVPLNHLDKDIVFCADCKRQAERILVAPRSGDVSDYARIRFPYYDESLDKTFKSKTEKEKYLKKKGLVQTDGAHGIKKEKRSTLYFT